MDHECICVFQEKETVERKRSGGMVVTFEKLAALNKVVLFEI